MNLTPQQITAPVRQRDARIELLEDLVRDLIARGPVECAKSGVPYCCRACRAVLEPRVRGFVTVVEAAFLLGHEPDCPYPRAERALKDIRP